MNNRLFPSDPCRLPIFLALLAGTFSIFAINIVDPDLWGHVQYGTDTWRRGELLREDPYSYLSSGAWINHELFSEATFAALEHGFGPAGMLIWKCLIGWITLGMAFLSARRLKLNPLVLVATGVAVLLTLRVGWLVRPQLFTFLFLSALMLVLVEHDHGKKWPLLFVPPLIVLWTNAHGGFLVGLGILSIHIAFACWRIYRLRGGGWRRRLVPMILVWVASMAAPLVNPYGIHLLQWLSHSLGEPRPEIVEWRRVVFWSREFFSFKMLAAASILALWRTKSARPAHHLVILAIITWQAFSHFRHIPIFGIVVAHYLPAHFNDCWRRMRIAVLRNKTVERVEKPSRKLYYAGFVILSACLFVLGIAHLRGIRVHRARFPVTAFQFIEDNGLEGRMVTEFNWSQYCIYSFWPRIKVSVDGRFRTVYSREVLDWNFDLMLGNATERNRSPKSGPFQPTRILEQGKPNLALIDRQKLPGVRQLEASADWVLLYQDALAQIWGRRSIYDDPNSARYLPPKKRRISDEIQQGYVHYPALPHKSS